jgi:hypothetical protein
MEPKRMNLTNEIGDWSMKLLGESVLKLGLASIMLGTVLLSTSFARAHRSYKAYHSYSGGQTYINRDSHNPTPDNRGSRYPTIDDFPVAGN